jgi:hypothetical protein
MPHTEAGFACVYASESLAGGREEVVRGDDGSFPAFASRPPRASSETRLSPPAPELITGALKGLSELDQVKVRVAGEGVQDKWRQRATVEVNVMLSSAEVAGDATMAAFVRAADTLATRVGHERVGRRAPDNDDDRQPITPRFVPRLALERLGNESEERRTPKKPSVSRPPSAARHLSSRAEHGAYTARQSSATPQPDGYGSCVDCTPHLGSADCKRRFGNSNKVVPVEALRKPRAQSASRAKDRQQVEVEGSFIKTRGGLQGYGSVYLKEARAGERSASALRRQRDALLGFRRLDDDEGEDGREDLRAPATRPGQLCTLRREWSAPAAPSHWQNQSNGHTSARRTPRNQSPETASKAPLSARRPDVACRVYEAR